MEAQLKPADLQTKWGAVLKPGFVAVPNVLLMRQGELGLSDGELTVLLHLVMSWWRLDEPPFLRPATIAKRMNVKTRTVQRHLARLEKAGYIGRAEHPKLFGRIAYNLVPLKNRLAELAATMPTPQILQQIRERKKARTEHSAPATAKNKGRRQGGNSEIPL